MGAPSLTYTLTNGSTADASQVMQNFNDLLNGITDGTKDLSISALTCAGTATLNGHINLGNASGDDLTITASLASTLPIKTDASFDIGTTSLGLRKAYFGGNSQRVGIGASASTSATYNFILPVSGGTANWQLVTDGSGNTSWTVFNAGYVGGSAISAGFVGEVKTAAGSSVAWTSAVYNDGGNPGLALTAGVWLAKSIHVYTVGSDAGITQTIYGVGTSAGSTGVTDGTGYQQLQPASHTPTGNQNFVSPMLLVNISTATTHYPKFRLTGTRGTGTVTSDIWAVRIA